VVDCFVCLKDAENRQAFYYGHHDNQPVAGGDVRSVFIEINTYDLLAN